MLIPSLPPDERERLQALRELKILDTVPEQRFDRITRLVQRLFNVPIALISLVDENRQWFKSCQGLDVLETPRDISFCGHSILGDEIFVVSDTLLDPRFADNPLVVGEPKIRFYAGYPLSASNGCKLGTLCVIDRQPKIMSEADQQLLRDLGNLVENEMSAMKERDEVIKNTHFKSQFLANMSHEIRTPMNAVIGFTEVLMRSGLTSEQKRLIDKVHGSGKMLMHIIDDILDFSKIEAGKINLETVDFDMRQIVGEATDMLAASAYDKKLAFKSCVDENVSAIFHGDPMRLKQILTNLLGNAVKFTKQGEVSIHVSVVEETANHTGIRFAIADSGIGLSAESQVGLFQSFNQADSSVTRIYGGTGLGLSISKKIVELMGGEIGLESTVGKGSVFWCQIPFQKQEKPSNENPDQTMSKEKEAPAVPSSPRRSFRVLLVEDKALNQEVALLQLQQLGYNAHVVNNGIEALDAFGHTSFDLILMDCQMPEMDGFAATLEIRRRERSLAKESKANQHVPIIAMTANALDSDRDQCFSAGMDDFLSKPIKLEKLAAVLSLWDAAIDETVIKNLQELKGQGSGFVQQLMAQYGTDAFQHMEAMKRAVVESDFKTLKQEAHAFKGISGSMGARRVQNLCARIEDIPKSGAALKTRELMDALEEEVARVQHAFQSKPA